MKHVPFAAVSFLVASLVLFAANRLLGAEASVEADLARSATGGMAAALLLTAYMNVRRRIRAMIAGGASAESQTTTESRARDTIESKN